MALAARSFFLMVVVGVTAGFGNVHARFIGPLPPELRSKCVANFEGDLHGQQALYLPYISPASPPYLPHISPTSPPYLPRISCAGRRMCSRSKPSHSKEEGRPASSTWRG